MYTRDPPPFMANAILNFHFDYWHTSLIVPLMNISEPLPEKWFFQPQGLLVGSGCTEIQQFRKPAPSPWLSFCDLTWSYIVHSVCTF